VVFHHPQVTASGELAQAVVEHLRELGLQAEAGSIDDEAKRAQAGEADMLIALGGDGTMLRVGRTGAFNNQPVLGINLGRLGFLMEVQPDGWREALEHVVGGNYRLEERLMLHAAHCQNGSELHSYEALNEVVVGRGGIFRPIRLQTFIDGEPLTTYVADGLIVATPTGSTAYALAAGGPIIPPESRSLALTPISPHLTFDRSLILPPETVIDIVVRTDHEAVFSIDGQTSRPLQDQDRLRVSLSQNIARFVRFQPPTQFYKTLAERMTQNPAADKAK
jgi:NAD+ kinase